MRGSTVQQRNLRNHVNNGPVMLGCSKEVVVFKNKLTIVVGYLFSLATLTWHSNKTLLCEFTCILSKSAKQKLDSQL